MMKKDRKTNHTKKYKEQTDYCQVCFETTALTQNLQLLKCAKCQKKAHKCCYQPNYKPKKEEKFICDTCQSNTTNPPCLICNRKDGLLKKIRTDKQNSYLHVICALFSNKITIKSFDNLDFELKGTMKQFKKRNQPSQTKQQFTCQFSFNECRNLQVFKCIGSQCKRSSHIYCLKKNQFRKQDDKQWVFIFEYLDKNNNWLRNLKKISQTIYRQFSSLIQQLNQDNHYQYVICQKCGYSGQFIYCYCGREINDDQSNCDRCKRWFHNSCQKIINQSQKENFAFTCSGCSDNNIYKKRTSIPQIIIKMVQIQQSHKKITQTQLKFLNNSPFDLSTKIIEKLKNSQTAVLQYYLNIYLTNLNKKHPKMFQSQQQSIKFIQRNSLDVMFLKMIGHSHNNTKNLIHLKQLKNISQDYTMIKQLLNIKFKNQIQKKIIQKLKILQQNIIKKKNISQELQQLSKIYKQYETLSKSKINLQNSLFNSIMKTNPSKFLLNKLIQYYKYFIIDQYDCREIQIDENQFHQFNTFINQFDKPAQNQILDLFKQSMNKIKIKWQYQKKNIFISKLTSQLAKKKCNKKSTIKIIQHTTIQNILYSRKESLTTQIQTNYILAEASKKKFINIMKTDHSSLLISRLISLLKTILTNPNLSKQQYKKFKKLQMKYNFLNKITMTMINVQEENDDIDSQQQMRGEYKNQYTVFQALKLLQDKQIQDILYQDWVTQLSILSNHKVQISQQQLIYFQNFLQKIVRYHSLQSDIKIKQLTPQKVLQILQIQKYLKLEQKFSVFSRQYQNYLKWKKPLQEYNLIENHLEKQQEIPKILKLIENLVFNCQTIKINVMPLLKKIKVLKLWCNISNKYFSCFNLKGKKKPTINSIQHFKQILDSSQYPHNQNYKVINRIYLQVFQINKKIGKFLEKNKSSQLQIYQELKIFKNKMTLNQAQQLLRNLNNLKEFLDVSAEIDQIQIQIKQFKQIEHLCQNLNKKQLKQMQIIKKKIFQSPIRNDEDQFYLQITKKLYQLKAQEPQFPISRKEFFKILHYGGIYASQFLQTEKGSKLFKLFKSIERSQKQFFQAKTKNEKNLLQLQDQKKFTQQYDMDNVQRENIKNYYEKAKKNKQKFNQLKYNRQQQYKFKILQQQISKVPINCKQIYDEIEKMIRQTASQFSKLKQLSLQDRLKSMNDVFKAYRSIPIKHTFLQKYYIQHQTYKNICKLAEQQIPSKYHEFHLQCQKCFQLKGLEKIKKIRYNYFNKMYHFVKNPGQYPVMEIFTTLIAEGSQIVQKLQTSEARSQVLNILLEVNKLQSEYKYNQQSDQDDRIENMKHSYQQNCFDIQDNDDDDFENFDEISANDQNSNNKQSSAIMVDEEKQNDINNN